MLGICGEVRRTVSKRNDVCHYRKLLGINYAVHAEVAQAPVSPSIGTCFREVTNVCLQRGNASGSEGSAAIHLHMNLTLNPKTTTQ